MIWQTNIETSDTAAEQDATWRAAGEGPDILPTLQKGALET